MQLLCIACITSASPQAMQVMQPIPLDDLRQTCDGQLAGMLKGWGKRAGIPMTLKVVSCWPRSGAMAREERAMLKIFATAALLGGAAIAPALAAHPYPTFNRLAGCVKTPATGANTLSSFSTHKASQSTFRLTTE
jgi:hypothetical protein